MSYGNERSDKRWEVRSVQLAQPAAGAEWLATVPAGAVWKVRSVHFQLVTSSTVASRQPILQVSDDKGNDLLRSISSGTQAASNTFDYTFAPAIAAVGSNGSSYQANIPQDLILAPGWTIGTASLNLQTGDVYQLISLLVESADAF